MIRLALALTVLAATVESRFLSAQEDKIPLPDTTLLDVQEKERGVPESGKVVIYKPKHMTDAQALQVIRSLMGTRTHAFTEPASNSVVFRGSEKELQEIKAVLDELDQPSSTEIKTIAFEVLFADLPAKGDGAQVGKAQPASEKAWLERLENLDDKTKSNFSNLRLTATEDQKAMVQFGEQTPVVTGVQQAFGGRGAPVERSPVVRQTQTGTIVQCTARVLEDGTILAELEIERSRLAPEGGALLDENDDRGALRTPGMLTTTCKTTVKLKPGQPRVLSGIQSNAANGSTLTLIVITAELLTPEK